MKKSVGTRKIVLSTLSMVVLLSGWTAAALANRGLEACESWKWALIQADEGLLGRLAGEYEKAAGRIAHIEDLLRRAQSFKWGTRGKVLDELEKVVGKGYRTYLGIPTWRGRTAPAQKLQTLRAVRQAYEVLAQEKERQEIIAGRIQEILRGKPRKILGLPENADRRALKKAYNDAVLRWHPDKCIIHSPALRQQYSDLDGAELNEFCSCVFREINQAYEALDKIMKETEQRAEEKLRQTADAAAAAEAAMARAEEEVIAIEDRSVTLPV